jgi:O-antigen/teichoic acid export membrane protein
MSKMKIAGFALGPLGSALIGFVTLPMLAWFFTAEDIGRISMLQVATNFAVILFTFGLDQGYAREYHEVSDKSALLKAAVAPGLLALLILMVALLSFDPALLSRWLFVLNEPMFSAVAAFTIVATFVSKFFSIILRMEEKGFAFSISQILPKALFLAIVAAYALFGVKYIFSKLLLANAAAAAAVTLIYGWNTRHAWIPALSSSIDRAQAGRLLNFGFPLIFGGLASWAFMAMDRLFLRNMSTLTELGVFSVSASVAAAAGIVSGIFTTIWAPTVYRWAAAGAAREKIENVTTHLLAAILSIFVVTGLFSWVISYLLPHAYDRVQYLVVASLAPPLLYALSECTAIGIALARKSIYSMLASFIAAAANFLGNYLLVPRLGASGAVISTAVSFMVFLIIKTEFSCRVWHAIPRTRLYSMMALVTGTAVCFVLFGEDHRLLFMGIWVGIGSIVFAWFRSSMLLAVHTCAHIFLEMRRKIFGRVN